MIGRRWCNVLTCCAGLLLGCDRLQKGSRLELSGTLELTEHAVGARVAGRLATVAVEEGQDVKKGEVLATLDRFEQANRDYERTVRLFEQGGSNQQAVEHAQLALEDQRIVSPVDGVILVKIHEPGETASAGAPLVVVGDRKNLWVRVYVPEGKVSRLRLQQPATLRFDGLSRAFKGHIRFIAPHAEFTPRNIQTPEERVTQTFAVKVALDEPEPFLRPGVSADVTIETAQ